MARTAGGTMTEAHAFRRICLAGLLAAAAAASAMAQTDADRSMQSLQVKKKVLRVLFIGNSLTSANDLPLMVHALAYADRRNLVVDSVVLSGASLEDHWLEGSALRKLRGGRWHLVVMQQGPSSLPESRVHLRQWTLRFAEEIYAVRARPVLFMVWPGVERNAFFDDVRESYALAAQDVGAIFAPAGEALRRTTALDPSARIYEADLFHPSVAGTYTAALSIYGALTGRDPRGLPSRFRLANGRLIDIPAGLAATLRRAAAEANREFAFSAPVPAPR